MIKAKGQTTQLVVVVQSSFDTFDFISGKNCVNVVCVSPTGAFYSSICIPLSSSQSLSLGLFLTGFCTSKSQRGERSVHTLRVQSQRGYLR